MTHWCSFHELILNWYSAKTQKFLFWGPKMGPKFHYPVITAHTPKLLNTLYKNRFLRSIMTHWLQFSWVDIKLVFSYNPKIPISGAQNGPKIAFSSNNSSETHRNYWKPYINRFLRSIMTHWCSFHELILNCIQLQPKNPYFGGKMGPKNSSETHQNP